MTVGRPTPWLALWVALVGACTGEEPCQPMCEALVELQESCLVEEALGWEALGYDDAADFADACLTWAWEMQLLEEEAGAVDAICAERTTLLRDGSCEDLAGIDWNTAP